MAVFFDITDLPADFGNAETASITVRTRGVDIGATPLKLFAQLFQSDETTTLSDEVEVAQSGLSENGYVDLVSGASEEQINTPDHADFAFAGDFDARFLVALDDWTPAVRNVIAAQFEPTGDQRGWGLVVLTTGQLQFLFSPDGANLEFVSNGSALSGVVNGEAKWLRVTYTSATGAVEFFTSDDGSSWTSVGSNTVSSGGVFDSNDHVVLSEDGSSDGIDGKFLAAEFRDGIDGTIIADPDFRTADQTSDGGLTFVDSSGKTWTLENGAEWIAPTDAWVNTQTAFTGLNTTADKSVWDNARIRFRWGT